MASKDQDRNYKHRERMNDPENVYVPLVYAHEGKSHFGERIVTTKLLDFAPPAPAAFVSTPEAVQRQLFVNLPVGFYGEPHPSPARQLMIMLSGEVEVTVSNGETRHFKAGDAIFVEDVEGEGHATRVVGNEIVYSVAIQ